MITGNLTRDPELRSTGGGTAVCELRVAVNSRRKDESGNWVDKPNYFDVTVLGAQGENCATYLRRAARWRSRAGSTGASGRRKDGSGKRQAVSIIANTVQFLGSRDGGGEGGGGNRFSAAVRRPGRHLGLRQPGAGAAVGASRRRHPLLGQRRRARRTRSRASTRRSRPPRWPSTRESLARIARSRRRSAARLREMTSFSTTGRG